MSTVVKEFFGICCSTCTMFDFLIRLEFDIGWGSNITMEYIFIMILLLQNVKPLLRENEANVIVLRAHLTNVSDTTTIRSFLLDL